MPFTTSEPRELSSPAAVSPAKRRLAAQHVREARDRLTSTSGTRPVFDYELLRLFAQNRIPPRRSSCSSSSPSASSQACGPGD